MFINRFVSSFTFVNKDVCHERFLSQFAFWLLVYVYKFVLKDFFNILKPVTLVFCIFEFKKVLVKSINSNCLLNLLNNISTLKTN